MLDSDGFTPQDKAVDLILGWIRMIHEDKTSDLADSTPEFAKATRDRLALFHDTLLDASELDGTPIVADRMDEEAHEDTVEMLLRVFVRDFKIARTEGMLADKAPGYAAGWWARIDPTKL